MSIISDMPTIERSSIMVTVLMGRLKTSPKQAHLIFFLSMLLFITPILLMLKINAVLMFVATGATLVRYNKPKTNSTKGYA